MKRIPVKQMRILVNDAYQKDLQYLEITRGAENPQVIEMRREAKGRITAWDCVRQALNGNPVPLRVYAE